MVALVRCAHPLPALAVTVFTVVVAVVAGAPRPWLIGLAVLAGQLSVGWSNDYADRFVDRAAGRVAKPLVRGDLDDRLLFWSAGGALGCCAALSFAVGLAPGSAHLVAVVAAWGYNLGLKRTVLSFAPYAVAFGLVPPWFVALALPGGPAPRPPLVAASALLGVSAHFANTVPDAAADAATGVRGLPQRLGPAWSAGLSAALLLVAAVLLVGPAAVALVVAYAVVAVRPNPRGLFVLNLLVVALLLTAFVAAGDDLT